jgi:hypothetical protein
VYYPITKMTVPSAPTQLDIFEHSHDVMLRNEAIDALRMRDAGACARALAALAAEYGADPLLPSLCLLCGKLQSAIPTPIAREAAIAILQETEGAVVAAAHTVFGRAAQTWLSPLWSELAAAIADFPFDSGREALHVAPLLLRAERWVDAAARIERIASWRRQPAPLGFMIEARCRIAGFDTIWPLLAELAWMAPRRAHVLAPRLRLFELDRLVRGFEGEFEGEGGADDFAWFPAWALVADSRLAQGMRLAQGGANTRPERCARIVLGLLSLERQGSHAELIDGRRKLREASPALFARYMQDR